MTLKKFALRGMIVLAAVIALCVLFSGTFRTLTTAKTQITHSKNDLNLNCYLLINEEIRRFRRISSFYMAFVL